MVFCFFFLIYIRNFYCGYRCIRAFGDKEKPVCLEGLKKKVQKFILRLVFSTYFSLVSKPEVNY